MCHHAVFTNHEVEVLQFYLEGPYKQRSSSAHMVPLKKQNKTKSQHFLIWENHRAKHRKEQHFASPVDWKAIMVEAVDWVP